MKLNKLAGLALAWVCLAGGMHAQEGQTPTPAEAGAEAAAAPRDQNKRSQVVFLRVWYVGSPASQRVTAVCQPESGDPTVLVSSMGVGTLREYRPLKPGSYAIKLLSGSVVPDGSGKIPSGAPALAEGVKMDLKAGSYGTVVIEEHEGKFTLSAHEDKPAPKQGGPAISIFDYLKVDDAKLRIVSNGNKKEVWNPKMGNIPSATGLVGTGDCRFELWQTFEGKERNVTGYETTLAPNDVCSVVFYRDRYGEPAMSVVQDASASISKEALDQLTQ